VDHKEYRKLIEERRSWYKTTKKVYCPCLKTDVVFNSKGFYHLRYDSTGKERSIDEQMSRLSLLPFSIEMISEAVKFYRHRKIKGLDYWSFQEIIGQKKVLTRVVLKKTTSGQVIFQSIFEKKDKKTVNK